MSFEYATFKKVFYITHVTGSSPHIINEVRPYTNLAQAKAQKTRRCQNDRGQTKGNFEGRIYRIDINEMKVELLDD